MDFSEKLKFSRERLMLSQEMLARELGVSFATISRLENQHTVPSLATRRSFAEFCKKNEIKFDMEDK